MSEICQINNSNIDEISLLFCSKCKSLLNKNAKKCNKCSKIFCDSCIKDTQCSNCKLGKLQDISINTFLGKENLLFYCNKSIKCKEKYTYEEKQKNHLHENQENINCNICKENLSQSPNLLECYKCQNVFCFKRLSYEPFLNQKKQFNLNKNKNCGIKCLQCYKPICSLCNKNNELICLECINIKIKKKEQNETKKCNICSNGICWNVCSFCNKNICLACANICGNNLCKNIICINCSLFCNICKNIICQKCSLKCSSCPPNQSLISCINCDSNAIIKCSLKNCSNKVCLNCLKFCNYCNEINCSSHSLSCANCSETICQFHWHMCKKCCSTTEGDFSKKKLCLKNCTKRCHFCNNEVNVFCKEENHPENFVKKYSCDHYICNDCLKKCDKCKELIKACPECENGKNYSYCKICDKYLCSDCSKECTICKKHYCDEMHKCFLCNNIINNEVCINCDYIERTKCKVCSKFLSQCEKCSRIIICSHKCFNEHIIVRQKIKVSFSRTHTSQSIKYNIANNVMNNVINLFQNDKLSNSKNKDDKNLIETDKGEHLCLMYCCDEHIKNDTKENIGGVNPREEEDDDSVKKYVRYTKKENVKCSSCIIC